MNNNKDLGDFHFSSGLIYYYKSLLSVDKCHFSNLRGLIFFPFKETFD